MNIRSRINKFRETLHLKNTVFEDIDDDLILLAITSSSVSLNREIKERLMIKYGSFNYQRLEFLGDSVLQMIITKIIYDIGGLNEGEMTKLRSAIVRNANLKRYYYAKKLCMTYISHEYNDKRCADIFESILGALFVYGFWRYGYGILDHIENWILDNFQIYEDIYEWFYTGEISSMPFEKNEEEMYFTCSRNL